VRAGPTAKWFARSVAFAAPLLVACAAHAADPPSAKTATSSSNLAPALAEEIPREMPTERVFYGWEIVASGEVGGLLVASSIEFPASQVGTPIATFVFLIGMPVFALGGPIVHWTHGHFEKGLLSFGLNVAGSIAGGLVGSSVRCSKNNAPSSCSGPGFFDGLAVAAVTMPLIDALALGWERVPISDPGTAHKSPPVLALQPIVNVGPRSAVVGLGGAF
jgi:hypothetical protein